MYICIYVYIYSHTHTYMHRHVLDSPPRASAPGITEVPVLCGQPVPKTKGNVINKQHTCSQYIEHIQHTKRPSCFKIHTETKNWASSSKRQAWYALLSEPGLLLWAIY